MPDYSKTVIYKIFHTVLPNLIYVGSTTDFSKRRNQHKSRSHNPNDKEHETRKYKMIRENGGWSAFDIIEIKKYPCTCKMPQ